MVGLPAPEKRVIALLLLLMFAGIIATSSYAQAVQSTPAAEHKGLESAVAFSQFLSQWAVISIGGSIALAFSTSYWRPNTRKVRFFYLLFLPAWGLLLWSLFLATQVQENLQALLNLKNPDEPAIKIAVNRHILWQTRTMESGLACLCFWLVIFLLWWIFFDPVPKSPPDEVSTL